MIDDALLGKMLAGVENNAKTNEEIKGMLREIRDDHKILASEVSQIRKELDMYGFMVKIVKTVGLVLLAVLTLKFGDIPKLWSALLS